MKKNVMLVLGILVVTIMLGLSGSILFGLFNNNQDKSIVFTNANTTKAVSEKLGSIVPSETISETYTVKNDTSTTIGVNLSFVVYIGKDEGLGQYLKFKITSGEEVLYDGYLLDATNADITVPMIEKSKKYTVSYHLPSEVTSEQAEGKIVDVSLKFVLSNE